MPKRNASVLSTVCTTTKDASSEFTASWPGNSMQSRMIQDANTLDIETFKERYVDKAFLRTRANKKDRALEISLKSSQDVESESEIDACFKLIQMTSRKHYQSSSWGWHPVRKKREMRESEMKYLLVQPDEEGGSLRPIWGFLSFMLTHDSTPSVPVLYIYEIHLGAEAKGQGVGGHLMRLAEDIALRAGVDKVMLTCFLANNNARSFYKRLGYIVDKCSPEDRRTRKKTIKVDYVILSKCINGCESATTKRAKAPAGLASDYK